MASKQEDDFDLGKPERLFNLTCVLLYAKEGLTKSEILSSVRGYDDDYVPGKANPTLDKKFERDKAALRQLGIIVDGEIPNIEDENNQIYKYRIKRETFSWPADVKLTPRQLALLNLAAQAWAGGSLSSEASRGITKLRALGVVGNSSDIVGISPKIQAFEPSHKELEFAVAENITVNFDYRNPETGEIKTRTVEPWVLRSIGGQWLVLGYDEFRKEPRNFMLRRIVSPVTQVLDSKRNPVTFEAPEQDVLDAAVESLNEHAKSQEAVLNITPGSEAWFRYEMDLVEDKKDTIHRMNYHDVYVLAEQLREYADQIEVLEPKQLAELVREGFRKVADLHG